MEWPVAESTVHDFCGYSFVGPTRKTGYRNNTERRFIFLCIFFV